jgi:hypothetical protein
LPPSVQSSFVLQASPHRVFASAHPLPHRYLQCLDGVYRGNNKSQCTPERNTIGHTHARFKRAGVGTNDILECKCLSKNAHRTR